MTAIERKAAQDAVAHAVCTSCRPVLAMWFKYGEAVDIDGQLCSRCLPTVYRLLGELMEHYR